MKKSCKKITAFTLSLAVIAGNAVNFLPNNNALTAKAAVSASAVSGKDESYYDAETETLHLKGYVKNSADGSGLVRPEGITGPITHLVADEGTVFPEDCSHLFEPIFCYDIDLRNADTSNVTDMSYMFCSTENGACFARDHFDISTFDTSNVTNMEGMFMNFSGFYKRPDSFCEILKNLDTSSVTNMSKMFKGAGFFGMWLQDCYDLEDITYFSSFDTSKVTDMSEMFANAYFPGLDLTNFDTSNVTTMSRMFENNTYLNKLDISTFDTSNVTDMSYMFNKAYAWGWGSGVKNVDMSSFNTSKVTDMSYMFADTCITSLDLSSFDTSNVTNMSHMFYGSEDLTSLDVSSFDTSRVKDMSYMFCRIGTFELDVRHFIISDDTNIEGMFIHSTRHGHEMYLILPYGWTIEKMKEKDPNIFWSSLNVLYISEAPDESYYDAETETLHLKGYIRNNEDGSGIVCREGVTGLIKHLVADEGTVLPPNCSHFCEGLTDLRTIDLKNADTSHVTDMSYMFVLFSHGEYCHPNSIDVSNFDTSNVTNMAGMFMRCGDCKLNLESFDTSKVTDMSWMFYELMGDSLNLSNFDTSNVTNMSAMFYFTILDSVDLSSFNTSNVTDMSHMFSYSSFTDIDLSSFDTSNVTNMLQMFRSSYKLKTIYVSNKWSAAGVSDGHIIVSHNELADFEMFDGCKKLIGGAGTVYDTEKTDSKYAHIDGGVSNPGYMTLKNDRNAFFKTQNLILSGQIGVSFNLNLSALTDKERTESYMEFTINGKTTKDYFDEKSKNASGKYYSFTCYVTSVEMADTITAVFHYGNDNTVSKKYSVLDYINTIEKYASSYDDKTLALIHSIADYGHYSQPFLASSNNWTIGKEHKEMTKYYTDSYSYDTLKKETSEFQRVVNLGKSDINSFTFSLSLKADTTLNVFIKPNSNYNGSIKITTRKNNSAKTYAAVKQADGRYKVTIPNISAHQLGDMYTVTAETSNGAATCSLSALSYVYAILSGSSYDKTAKDAVSAFYKYYEATMNYRNK